MKSLFANHLYFVILVEKWVSRRSMKEDRLVLHGLGGQSTCENSKMEKRTVLYKSTNKIIIMKKTSELEWKLSKSLEIH